jgi:hypothetical protein
MFDAEVVVDAPGPAAQYSVSFHGGGGLQHNKKRPIVEWAPVIRNRLIALRGLGRQAHGVCIGIHEGA